MKIGTKMSHFQLIFNEFSAKIDLPGFVQTKLVHDIFLGPIWTIKKDHLKLANSKKNPETCFLQSSLPVEYISSLKVGCYGTVCLRLDTPDYERRFNSDANSARIFVLPKSQLRICCCSTSTSALPDLMRRHKSWA